MGKTSWMRAAVLTCCLVESGPAVADSLRDALVPPRARNAGVVEDAIRPLGSVIGAQLASQIPAFSTSAGFTYEYNTELEVFERTTRTFGPLFAERAATIGQGKFNINASYSWVRFDTFNGKNLDDLTSRVEIAEVPGEGQFFSGIRNSDGFLTQLKLKLDLEAHLFDFSFTYGLLPNLDVNIDLPVLRTYARSGLTDIIPDPRCVAAGVEECETLLEDLSDTIGPGAGLGGFLRDDGFFVVPESADRASSIGIGDIRLRSKYLPIRKPVSVAGLLDLILPTGDTEDFQGTGDTRLGTSLIVSHDAWGRVEGHAQAGVEFNINDIDRSQARYVAGVTGQVTSFAAVTLDFIGRSEFGQLGHIPNSARLPAVRNGTFVENTREEIEDPEGTNAQYRGRPFFIDIERNDILDLAVGTKLTLGVRTVLFANVLIPLNDDGLRANFVPTVGLESTF